MNAERVGHKVWVLVALSDNKHKVMVGIYGGSMAMGGDGLKWITMKMDDETSVKFTIHKDYIGDDELDLVRRLLRSTMANL